MAGKLEGLGVDNIDVGGRNGEDDAIWLCDELRDEVASLLFDVGRLVTDRYLWRGLAQHGGS